MSKGKVVVLGSNGHLGHAALIAFRDAGWDVTGFGRTNRKPVSGAGFIAGDANDPAALKAAVADADVVVNGLHLPYDKWGNGAAEAQLQAVLDAMGTSGKTLMFPGTIYNYRAADRTVSPATTQSAEKAGGDIRIRLEAMIRKAAEAGAIRGIVIRAGDFFGPGNRGEWYEAAILMAEAKGTLYHLGDLPLRHSWSYLPDLGRAFVAVAEQRTSFAPFENFHFAGHWISHATIMDAVNASLGGGYRVRPFPWWMVKAMGVVNPVMRALYEMRYLWRNEMELVDPCLDALLGPNFITPVETAIDATVSELVAARKAA